MSAVPYEELNLGGAVGDDPAAVDATASCAARALGVDPARVVWMNQVHGRDVAVVDGPGAPGADVPAVDAVVTARRGLALAVLTADCTPVLLADPVAGVVAAAHAGGPGMVAGVVPAAVEAMVGPGRRARPDRRPHRARGLRAVLRGARRTMRAEVAAAVPAAYAETSWGTPAVDVTAGVHAQLERLGVRDRQQSPVCTLESRRPLLLPPRPHHRPARGLCLAGLIGHDGP